MEAKVHNELSLFLTQHNLQDTISQIDSIVLSYLIGILELIGQGQVEDCFDLADVMEMMNAYLPGFDQISRDSVLKWMFDLAAHLQEGAPLTQETVEENPGCAVNKSNSENIQVLQTEMKSDPTMYTERQSTFPCYDYAASTRDKDTSLKFNSAIARGKDGACDLTSSKTVAIPHQKVTNGDQSLSSRNSPSSPPSSCPSFPTSMAKQEKQRRKSGSKRKERYLSCSSQDSQEDAPSKVEIQVDIDDSRVRSLLEMFPAACSMEASHCLQLSNGDLDIAAQLIMDRQEAGQAITGTHSKSYQKRDRKLKKTGEYKLDDDSIKSTMLERYSFIDTEEDKKTYKPPPLKNEAKKLVRYRNGQIVSLKGERFSEVKKASQEDSSKK